MITSKELEDIRDRLMEKIAAATVLGIKVSIDALVIERGLLEIAFQLAVANEEARDERIKARLHQ